MIVLLKSAVTKFGNVKIIVTFGRLFLRVVGMLKNSF